MSRRILVSLISDQTIPNIEFIKEKQNEVSHFMFLSTEGMERKKCREWILNTAKIEESKIIEPIIVNAFSFEDIELKLDSFINADDHYIVNLTGGTKIMSLTAYEFFKTLSSEMYYLTGRGEYIKIHPGRKKTTLPLQSKLNLQEYLTAYGFELKDSSEPLKDRKEVNKILHYFLHSFDKDLDIPVLQELRNYRSKKNTPLEKVEGLDDFLKRLEFIPKNENKISKYECRYLTGDWLEEYLYYYLLDNYDIDETDIGLSWIVEKNGTPNEFDVLLMRKNKLYLFECKTSIYEDKQENKTFITKTIYKSDSLRNKFGLFAQTIVVTLSNLANPKLKQHKERAEISRVKLIGQTSIKEDLLGALNKV